MLVLGFLIRLFYNLFTWYLFCCIAILTGFGFAPFHSTLHYFCVLNKTLHFRSLSDFQPDSFHSTLRCFQNCSTCIVPFQIVTLSYLQFSIPRCITFTFWTRNLMLVHFQVLGLILSIPRYVIFRIILYHLYHSFPVSYSKR